MKPKNRPAVHRAARRVSRIAAMVLHVKGMTAQAPLLTYLRTPTAIGICSGSSDVISPAFHLRVAATLPRGSPARHRGLQTDFIRVYLGWQTCGHILRAQRVGIDHSHYVHALTLILVRQHEHAFWDAQG